MNAWHEVNFDGLVGPTYTFSGLSFGNVASLEHTGQVSSPLKAALQGLDKMRFLAELGIKQAVLPPQERPHIPTLKNLGFSGTDAEILNQAKASNFWMLAACSSASSMWAANSVTMAPSLDTKDKKAHITPANLIHNFHRSLEAPATERVMRSLFADADFFSVHSPLPASCPFFDEGAANHTRFCKNFSEKGFHLFVYGKESKKYPARATEQAQEAIARLHRLDPNLVLFAKQSPEAIDQGVFHNDVISTGHQDLLFTHEKAFVNTPGALEILKTNILKTLGWELEIVEIKEKELSLKDAVKTYLFNSQIVTKRDGTKVMIAPEECRGLDIPFKEIHYFDVKQSMQNGGGPACLRSRFVLNEAQIDKISPRVILDDSLYKSLKAWINKHYRDQLKPSDLADPDLLKESLEALDELTKLLQLGSLYDFQR